MNTELSKIDFLQMFSNSLNWEVTVVSLFSAEILFEAKSKFLCPRQSDSICFLLFSFAELLSRNVFS